MMYDFLRSSELWSNILGGVASALILAGIYWVVNYSKRKNIHKLIELENQSIQHLIEADTNQYTDHHDFHDKASRIRKQAIETAGKISPSAGALIKSVVVEYFGGDEIQHWYPILEELNKRIKIILEAHV